MDDRRFDDLSRRLGSRRQAVAGIVATIGAAALARLGGGADAKAANGHCKPRSPNGCCTSRTGRCRPGNDDNECGSHGQRCRNCSTAAFPANICRKKRCCVPANVECDGSVPCCTESRICQGTCCLPEGASGCIAGTECCGDLACDGGICRNTCSGGTICFSDRCCTDCPGCNVRELFCECCVEGGFCQGL